MPRLLPGQLVDDARPEASSIVSARIRAAWERARERNRGRPNAALQGRQLLRACALDDAGRRTLKDVSAQLDLTARSIHRMMRVARTVADLRGRGAVGAEDVLAATSMRDRSMDVDLAA